ncbi:[NiFe]-hydrogenase assembly chaperone HybE [Bathymodiolus septemdierum thioautotrophic gill symbiont]|uniref:Hydrogenase expression/formation protein HupJ n=1 Tax=endosymbiont of Bathymodiolus septemdierum str. Myojin knoll TaxID=1303921 RepID=A0A0P0UQC8_9GAMM|nr:[NiFe]-hydrogenase assembly chaperone HybE [Bathymodiolus septemdierum thioautotrophic gill symbiont]BAS67244.1 hydrogenase expression/formation protein HupJ [endosymbiont of Bathymodiolus septemdierum str. Myojin knoll]
MDSDNVKRLKSHYQYVHTHKMNDIPILNNKLEVETVGFVNWGEENSKFASEVGILITPWFMNIVLLPKEIMQQKARVGKTANILFPDGEYSFLTQLDDEFGIYLTCSLFSPMSNFSTQQQAVETAEAIMAQLLQSDKFKETKKNEEKRQQKIKDDEILNKVASRRDFLRGKSSAGHP